MADWTHKRLLKKLDSVEAQRDKLLAAVERLMANADEIPAPEDLIAVINDDESPEAAKQQAEAFLNLLQTISELKASGGEQQ